MDAIVTARVPVEIKEQVNAILKEIDSTPTKLINAAYEYVLATHMLPSPRLAIEYEGPSSKTEKRKVVITRAIREEVERSMAACTLEMPQSFWDELGDRDYKDYIAEMRRRDYEALD